MTALLAAARALHFLSLMAMFGGSAFAWLTARAQIWGAPVRPVQILFVSAASLAIVSGVAWLCLIAGQMSGGWQGMFDPATLELVMSGTRFGQIFTGRFIGLAILWIMCVAGIKSDRPAIPILAGLLLASLAPISHAAAGGRESPFWGTLNDAVHLLTAGFWLGALMVLALLISRRQDKTEALADQLRLFSRWGSFVVAMLVLTGLINAASILPASARSLHNSYVDVLLSKIGLVSIMAGLAATNRWHFVPDLKTDRGRNARYLAISIQVELLLGMMVVAIVGYLGLMAPD